MVLWNLATRDNWQLILSDKRVVTYTNNSSPQDLEYKYKPISPILATPESHILLIGTKSATAKEHWFLGARASQYLYVSPSRSGQFISGVQVSDVKKIGLNRLTLVEFSNYNISPYVLQLEIPYWLEDIYVEVWEYKGEYTARDKICEELSLRIDEIEAQLDRIEANLNNRPIESSPEINASSQFDDPNNSASTGII